MHFLINCKTFGVFPKFIYVQIRNIDEYDTLCLKRNMRNNAILKRIRERNDFDKKIRNIETIKPNSTKLISLFSKNYFSVTQKRLNNLLLRPMKRNYEM